MISVEIAGSMAKSRGVIKTLYPNPLTETVAKLGVANASIPCSDSIIVLLSSWYVWCADGGRVLTQAHQRHLMMTGIVKGAISSRPYVVLVLYLLGRYQQSTFLL